MQFKSKGPFIIFFLFCFFSQAQNREIDSLLQVVKQHKQDSELVYTFIIIGKKAGYDVGNYDTAFYYIQKAKSLAEKISFPKGVASAHINIGHTFYHQGNYSAALKNYVSALKINEEIKNKFGMANAYASIGVIYYQQGNYPEALKNYFSSLKIYEEKGNKYSMGDVYGNIGNVYVDQGNYSEALKNYLAALEIFEKLGNKYNIASSYLNIGGVYGGMGNHTEAINTFLKSQKICEEIGDIEGVAYAHSNLGSEYHKLGNFSEALKNFNTSLKISAEIDDKRGMTIAYTNMGVVHTDMRKIKEAKGYFQKGLNIAKEIGSKDDIKTSYTGLAKVDSALGNYKEAYQNYKLSVVYRDSVLNEENTKKTVQQAMQYEFDKKQTADSLKIAEERNVNEIKFKQERSQRYFLYGGLTLVLLFAGFIFNRFKVTQKQKNIIEQKELETQKQNIIITEQKHLIEERHKEITDSINYAERIQRSFMATKKHLDENISEYFVLFKPKDVVSGDFYWSATLNNQCFALVTADSTGHGVPGAIMSLLNITSLEKAIEKESSPEKILNITRNIVIERLKKDGSAEGGKDGMDCSLCVYDRKNKKLFVASANNPVWIIRGVNLGSTNQSKDVLATEEEARDIIEIKPDKMPVGKHDRQNEPFTLHEIDLQKGDLVYTLTDGFPDQFGGDKGKKFMSKKLRELLVANANLTMAEQKALLEKTFADWVGNLEQVDDVTVIGIKV